MTMWKSFTQRWVSFSVKRPWLVLSCAMVLAAITFFLSSSLIIRGDFAALLPDNFPSVKGFNKITEKVGGLGFMIIVIEGKDPKEVANLTKDLAPRFEKLKDIRFVQFYKADPFIRDRALYLIKVNDLKLLNKRLHKLRRYIKAETRKRNPLVVDLLDDDDDEKPAPVKFDDLLKKYKLSEKDLKGSNLIGTRDGKMSVMLLQAAGLESDLKFIKRMIASLKKTVQTTLKQNPKRYGTSLKIGYTGRYMVRLEDDNALRKQISFASTLSLIGVLVLLLLYTRRKRSLLLIGMPLVIGVVWTGGVVRLLTGGEVNIMTAFIVAVLFGLGIDFGIHLFSHYLQERRHGFSLEESLRESLSSTGAAGIVAVSTSAAAFFIIQLTDFKGLSQFGMVAGIGLFVILAAMIIIFPVLAVLIERSSPLAPQEVAAAPRRHTSKIDILAVKLRPHRLLWSSGIGLGLILLVGGAYVVLSGSLHFEHNVWRLINQGPAVLLYNRLKKDVFGGEAEPGIVMFPDHKTLRQTQRSIETSLKAGKWPTIRTVYSVHSVLPSEASAQFAAIREIQKTLKHKTFGSVPEEHRAKIKLLRKLANAKPYTMADLPKSLLGSLGNRLPLLYVVPKINPTQVDKAMLYAKDLQDMNKSFPKINLVIGDSNYILADMFRLMKRDGPRAVLFAFLAVILVLLIDLRKRFSAVFLVLCPLIVGFGGLFFMMGIFGIKLNPFNIVMLPVTLGLGIDHGVYMYRRWHEKGRGPVIRTLKPLFFAILLASFTSLIGFGSLAGTSHPGIKSTGLLAALGIISCTLTAFVVLTTLFSILAYARFKKLSAVLGKQGSRIPPAEPPPS